MRLRFFKNAVIASFVILVGCLWYIQCVRSPRYKELSRRNRIRLVSLPGPRGNIYDRNKNLLVGNRLAFDCAVIPQEFGLNEEKMKGLGSILKTENKALRARIKKNTIAPFISVVLKKDIGKETAIAISERSADFPGLIIQTYPLRYYPNGRIGSHVTGYLGKINEEEFNTLSDYGYETRDFMGRGGLEFFYDNYLRGEDGGMQTEVDSRGRQLQVLGIKEPQKGKDLTLTIDLELEKYVDSLLSEHKGAIIIMDSSSGEILTLLSKPDFDPNIFVSSNKTTAVKNLLRRKDYPLVDRAISGTYALGSVFKIVTASAGLELNKIKKNEQLDCQGFYILGNRRFNCWKESGHGLQVLKEAIKNSCNVFFYQVGRRVGVDGLASYSLRYGFGKPTQIDLPYESSGIVPSRAWKRRFKKEPWYEGETLNYAIGQGYLSVTPLQVLRMVNTVASEGELVRPFLVKKIDALDFFTPDKKRLNISKDTFRAIKDGMRKAVGDSHGTAGRARVAGLQIAGKTGTAETGSRGTHAWFAGFSPVEKPKISLVVFLEYGGKGGDKPCRIASNIFAKLKEMGYL